MGQIKTQVVTAGQPSKHAGTIRLGRDPDQCDIVLLDLSVSRLHVEIFFDPNRGTFCLRNLRPTNPPLVNDQTLMDGECVLLPNSTIRLGELQLQVVMPFTQAPTILAASSMPTMIRQMSDPVEEEEVSSPDDLSSVGETESLLTDPVPVQPEPTLPQEPLPETPVTPPNPTPSPSRLVESVITVSPSGKADYQTITQAIEQAQPHTRIRISEGIYDEYILIDKPLEIVADGD
jgi:hypothetical protein